MNPDILIDAGLSRSEALLYFHLLKYGSISVSKLAKRLSLDRTAVYHSLSNLEKKSLVNYIIRDNKKFYEAADPENLLGPIKAQEELVENIIPKLRELELVKEEEQEVKVYEGKEGVRVMYNDFLKANHLFSYGASGKSFDILKFEMPHLIKKAIRQGFKGKIVTHSKFKDHEMTKVPGISVRYLDTVESTAVTTVYKNKVALLIFAPHPLLVIIKHKELARSYKAYFDMLWKIAK